MIRHSLSILLKPFVVLDNVRPPTHFPLSDRRTEQPDVAMLLFMFPGELIVAKRNHVNLRSGKYEEDILSGSGKKRRSQSSDSLSQCN